MQATSPLDKHESPAMRLRKTLESGRGLTVCPGVYDGLSARIALDVGFDALYMVCPFAYKLSSQQ
jgi:methylisocitrate lyase